MAVQADPATRDRAVAGTPLPLENGDRLTPRRPRCHDDRPLAPAGERHADNRPPARKSEEV